MIKSLSLADLKERFSAEVDWLWKQHIPGGYPIALIGREGIGKTTLVLQIVKEILEKHEGKIIWCPVEGAVKDTVTKTEQLGITDRLIIPEHINEGVLLRFPKDLSEFKQYLEELTNNGEKILAVVFDSLRSLTPYEIKSDMVGQAMGRLNSVICDKFGISIIYIHHCNKNPDREKLDRTLGSVTIGASVRLIFMVDKKSHRLRTVRCIKNNLGFDFPELHALKTPQGIVIYEPDIPSEETMMEKAEDFLLSLFTNEETIASYTVYRLAEEKGISPDVLNKAKQSLGFTSTKTGKHWFWKRPSISIPSYPSSKKFAPDVNKSRWNEDGIKEDGQGG